ncbi:MULTISPECIES: sulfur carrier protein ThiS [Roseobacteraceae]|jgi:sulfur carrier protein|uniref:Sulfur carrier protein ThiS n=1 Tax=Pseudosulfitobacter pseudonitzschiae TaxID=1402135 RepID=A0A221K6R1_9RHOB|nr:MULTISPECIES: sulfur carrier protein ThiS [Roseobacteraceae]ASM74666.1 sulfur carrier protein ThiS [Pseudosulfitobacter pseudonitzschiae]
MKLQLNGEPLDTPPVTLADLLDAQGFGGAKIATAVNGSFVPATARAARILNDGDQIEVLAPMQGG